MNSSQRNVLMIAAAAVVATLMYAPYSVGFKDNIWSSGFAWIGDLPRYNGRQATVNIGLLLVEWVGILIAAGLLMALFRGGGGQADSSSSAVATQAPQPPSSDTDPLARVRRMLTDEKFQNEHQVAFEQYRSGTDRFGSKENLGLDADNAIPVNGVVGEIMYLSLLRLDGVEPIVFHRLGSVSSSRGMVDSFEWIGITSGRKGRVFLNFNYERKSRDAPVGFELSAQPDNNNPIYGTSATLPQFPSGISEEVRAIQKSIFGLPMPLDGVRRFESMLQRNSDLPPPLPPRSKPASQ